MRGLAIFAAAVGVAAASAGATAPADVVDYAQTSSWLCRPDRADSCSRAELETTTIAADGRRSIVPFRPAAQPTADCFYVYPTASRDPTPNSDLQPGADEEILTTEKQAARFRSVCRLFVPLYRQTTLGGTVGRVQSSRTPPGQPNELAYADVQAAWRHYLAHDNRGRGVVLLGASQGALNLKKLLREEIDGKPVQRQLIAAYLIGNAVAVPSGQAVGGDFHSIPLCREPKQFGCIVTYSSFRATDPPPADSLFGRLSPQRRAQLGPGMAVGCTNPAALGGGRAVIDSYFDTANRGNFHLPAGSRTRDGKPVETPYVRLPGLLSAACVDGAHATYLAISINDDDTSARTPQFYGDTVIGGAIQPSWGLHTIDIDLLEGDLIALAARQAAAWHESHRDEQGGTDNATIR